MPHILPIEKKLDLNELVTLCDQSKEAVFLTKDGEGALAVMNMETYDKLVKGTGQQQEEMDAVDLLISLQEEMEK